MGAIERLAAAPTDTGFVLQETWPLRMSALLTGAEGDEAAYRDYRDRYRAMAASLGRRRTVEGALGQVMTATCEHE